jgi:hypothetical protein
VYAIVEKVVLEPNENSPERIQIWGVFSVARSYTQYEDVYPVGSPVVILGASQASIVAQLKGVPRI